MFRCVCRQGWGVCVERVGSARRARWIVDVYPNRIRTHAQDEVAADLYYDAVGHSVVSEMYACVCVHGFIFNDRCSHVLVCVQMHLWKSRHVFCS